MRVVAYGAALVGSLSVALVGLGTWVFAQGQYLEDYCITGAALPAGVGEGQVVRGPSWDSPVHLRCAWEAHPDVVVLDPLPLIGGVVVALVAVVMAVTLFWSAHRATRPVASRGDRGISRRVRHLDRAPARDTREPHT